MKEWQKTGRDHTRYLVRQRDGFRCKKCKKGWQRGARHLDVHHLDDLCGKVSRGYDSITKINRLITLCHKCHFSVHPPRVRATYSNGRSPKRFSRTLARSYIKRGITYDRAGKLLGVSAAAVFNALHRERATK